MSKYLEHACKLRAIIEPHYNCCQSVAIPFAQDAGISEADVYRLAMHFAGGMRMGAACGALTGGLMVLGLFGLNDPAVAAQLTAAFAQRHSDMLNCADLLRVNAEAGHEKKPHCDTLVYEVISLVEDMLRSHGKL